MNSEEIEARQKAKKIDADIPEDVYKATIAWLTKRFQNSKIEDVDGPLISWHFTPKKVSVIYYINGGSGQTCNEFYQTNILRWAPKEEVA